MELMALQEGLMFALQHNFTPLEVNVNSTEISTTPSGVYREQNQVADHMAKQGATLPVQTTTTELLEAPLFVMHKYIDDQRGTLHQRSTTANNTLGHTSFCLHMLSNTCTLNMPTPLKVRMGAQQYF
uniref:Uncharacterized protein LOC104226074 n=1 Tax=Nicotiana sylvestris TaxID=4096 RepID=A0A1U7WNK9_NICSY|nr:PREDICTED: uncharacterized protein LOC104226074 [Nicotiana sylvestris]